MARRSCAKRKAGNAGASFTPARILDAPALEVATFTPSTTAAASIAAAVSALTFPHFSPGRARVNSFWKELTNAMQESLKAALLR